MARKPLVPRGETRVSPEPVDTTPLLTVRGAMWRRALAGDSCATVQGAIVRLVPDDAATDQEVEKVERALRQAGALEVKTMARRAKETILAPEVEHVDGETPRQAVEHLRDAANTDDRPALAQALEEALGVAGL